MVEQEIRKTSTAKEAPLSRDYTRTADVQDAITRLVSGLREDGDDSTMFEFLSEALIREEYAVMEVIRGSIARAQTELGQDRRTGSSATLLYPVEAALRVVAKKQGFIEGDALSAKNWSVDLVIRVLKKAKEDVVTLAGSNTTAKNLPQRAAHLLWLLDQCPQVPENEQLVFIEIGASGGFILDALRQPKFFSKWMQEKGYRSDFGAKVGAGNLVLGIDLVKSDLDWLLALILDDGQRKEVEDFILRSDRSPVIEANAAHLEKVPEVMALLKQNERTFPVIFSCFAFYQMDESTRLKVTQSVQRLLQSYERGVFIISDIAKYRGYPNRAGGCVSWGEDAFGNIVTPKISLSKATLTEWEILGKERENI